MKIGGEDEKSEKVRFGHFMYSLMWAVPTKNDLKSKKALKYEVEVKADVVDVESMLESISTKLSLIQMLH